MQTQRYWIVLGTTVAALTPPVRSLLTDHPYFYMDPQWELVWGLLSGATVYAVGGMSTTRFWERVRKHNIEWAWFPNPILKHPETPQDGDNPIRMFAAGAISEEAIREAEARTESTSLQRASPHCASQQVGLTSRPLRMQCVGKST